MANFFFALAVLAFFFVALSLKFIIKGQPGVGCGCGKSKDGGESCSIPSANREDCATSTTCSVPDCSSCDVVSTLTKKP